MADPVVNPIVLPPPPIRQPIADQNGIMAPVWVTWFNQLYGRAGGSIAPNTNDIIITEAFSNDSSNQQAQGQIEELSVSSVFGENQSNAEKENLEEIVAQLPPPAKNIFYRQVTNFVPTFTGLTATGSPTITGSYTRIGNLLYFEALITPGTDTSSVLGTTFLDNLPYTAAVGGTLTAINSATRAVIGTGKIDSGGTKAYTPNWSTVTDPVLITGIVLVVP